MAYDKVAYNTKYNKENYTELKFRIPKGQKDIIKAHWVSKGYSSLNAYINELIRRDMEQGAEESSKTVNIGRDNNGTINM